MDLFILQRPYFPSHLKCYLSQPHLVVSFAKGVCVKENETKSKLLLTPSMLLCNLLSKNPNMAKEKGKYGV